MSSGRDGMESGSTETNVEKRGHTKIKGDDDDTTF